MPVEGQWRRANTPLSPRDKRLLAAVAATAAIAALALAIAYAVRPASTSNEGCVGIDVPSTMGGARLRTCGAAARVFCHTQGELDNTIAAACRRQGYAADLHP
jgi:hypothetical protein